MTKRLTPLLYLLMIVCLLLPTAAVMAQADELGTAATAPAAVVTPEATDDPAPVVVVVDTPPPGTPSIYDTVVNRLADLIIVLVSFAGGYALISAWRNPDQAKQFVTFGLAVLEFGAKLTPTEADDAAVEKLRTYWRGIITEAVAASVQATIDAERAKLAQAAAEYPIADTQALG